MNNQPTTIRDLIAAGKINLETVVLGDISMVPQTEDGALEFPRSRPWHLFDDGEIVQESEYGQVKHSKFGNFGGHHRPRFSTKEAAEQARSEA